MKLLIEEDDPEIARMIREGLDEAGYFTTVCRDGQRAALLAAGGSYALILLDVMLPTLDAIAACARVRQAGVRCPILMLTARDSLADRVAGLDAGADDYLVKPFEFAELLARVRALLRREPPMKRARIHVDDLVVDAASGIVTRAGVEIPLTRREYTLLAALASHAGQILNRQAILDRVFLDDRSVSNTVEVFIKNLRRKVDTGSHRKLIHTVYGRGYVLRTEAGDAIS